MKNLKKDVEEVLNLISEGKVEEDEYQLVCETIEPPPVVKEISESEVEKFFEIVSYVVNDVLEGRMNASDGTHILMDNFEETYL